VWKTSKRAFLFIPGDPGADCPYYQQMNASGTANMELLKNIALRVMLERGLLPGFFAAVYRGDEH
jgi:hypothetical protein